MAWLPSVDRAPARMAGVGSAGGAGMGAAFFDPCAKAGLDARTSAIAMAGALTAGRIAGDRSPTGTVSRTRRRAGVEAAPREAAGQRTSARPAPGSWAREKRRAVATRQSRARPMRAPA